MFIFIPMRKNIEILILPIVTQDLTFIVDNYTSRLLDSR